MKITSRASDYALLLLMYLTTLPSDSTVSVKTVAKHHHLSLRFLANIANRLSMARILFSHRGVGGGIRLGRPPSEITVREVIEAVDGPIQTMFCQNTHELCSHEGLCDMKNFWDEIQGDVMKKLTSKTIGDLIPHDPVSIAV